MVNDIRDSSYQSSIQLAFFLYMISLALDKFVAVAHVPWSSFPQEKHNLEIMVIQGFGWLKQTLNLCN